MLIPPDHRAPGVYEQTVNSLLPAAHIIKASLKTLFLPFKSTATRRCKSPCCDIKQVANWRSKLEHQKQTQGWCVSCQNEDDFD